MKIGIVTYHRTLNYGACLQAIATRLVLEKMGHEVYYVDYWPDYHKEKYQLFPWNKFKKSNLLQKVKYVIKIIKYFNSQKSRIDNFEKFFYHYIYPYCRPTDDYYDVVIYGSDQIWRKQSALGTYNPFYFGENIIKTKHHISYAASMGILPDNDSDKERIKMLASHLHKISVREEGLRMLLLSLGYTDAVLSLDPTLLLSSEEWDKQLQIESSTEGRYALMYLLGSNPFDMKDVQRFAKSRGLKLIVLRGYATSKETETNITSAGPLDFIRLIKNAEIVFSASFHGLAFSIIYRKQFYSSFMRNTERASSLLEHLGIKGRLLPAKSAIPTDSQQINYDNVKKRLDDLRTESLAFLSSINNL